MKVFATLIDEVQAELQDDGTDYTDTFVAIQLEDAIREVSSYKPYIVKMTFALESRTGKDTAGTANKLTDGTNSQFLTTDADKVIYNTTDETWATVVSRDDENTLSISKNIMASGESYAMFNKGCTTTKQLNLEDAGSYLWIDNYRAEFPIAQDPAEYRNITIDGDIATIDYDLTIEDSATGTSDVDVSIWFAKCHKVSQLTDLSGTVNGTPAANAETMVVADFSGIEVIAEDTELTIAGVRGTYRITQNTTLSDGAGTVYFSPGLESAAANSAVITVKGSTLDRQLERLVVSLASAQCLISKSLKYILTANVGGTDVARQMTATGHDKLSVARDALAKLVKFKSKRIWPKE